jgi:methylglutaconyl-CoA hydratase
MTDLLTTIDAAGTANVRLNRPAKHNAFDAALIAALCDTFRRLAVDPAVRAVVLSGEGPSFSAGADANWMRASASLSESENRADALRLSDMLKAVNDCPKPVIAVAHGFVFGGGVGLVACADMAVARAGTRFKLSEVRLAPTPHA